MVAVLVTHAQKASGELEQQAAQRQQELLDPIEQKVNTAIELVRAAGGYAMIFDVGVARHGIVGADRSLDLTQAAIHELATLTG